GIADGCAAITPDMLPLVQLSQQQIDGIVAAVPGGAANIQDIYPLAPLQEGILFHHMMQSEGDAYIMPTLIEFDTRARLDGFLAALQVAIDRHDILRTAVLWDGLAEPVQVVLRSARMLIEEVGLVPADGEIAAQLSGRYDPHHYRIDVRQAPLLRAFLCEDRANGRWLLQLLTHHLAIDHTTLEILVEEIHLIQQGREAQLPPALPFRNFVAQARLGVSQQEHEAFFAGMLADIDEPTAPYGLLDVRGDGSQ
ncbi:condensation domain-containing protein, partial [Duganella rhizosphaerae]|uniref:condensation domain-containing protein n=1 Tax=Duganella rhizosphaerae TaxID=2885763 RepID=UPI00403F544D